MRVEGAPTPNEVRVVGMFVFTDWEMGVPRAEIHVVKRMNKAGFLTLVSNSGLTVWNIWTNDGLDTYKISTYGGEMGPDALVVATGLVVARGGLSIVNRATSPVQGWSAVARDVLAMMMRRQREALNLMMVIGSLMRHDERCFDVKINFVMMTYDSVAVCEDGRELLRLVMTEKALIRSLRSISTHWISRASWYRAVADFTETSSNIPSGWWDHG